MHLNNLAKTLSVLLRITDVKVGKSHSFYCTRLWVGRQGSKGSARRSELRNFG